MHYFMHIYVHMDGYFMHNVQCTCAGTLPAHVYMCRKCSCTCTLYIVHKVAIHVYIYVHEVVHASCLPLEFRHVHVYVQEVFLHIFID